MTPEQQQIMIDAFDDPSLLTAREADFIQDLMDQDEDYELTEAQEDFLSSIARKYG